MDVQVLNGTSRINGNAFTAIYGMNGTSRINSTARINGVENDLLREYYISLAMDDKTALQGIGFFGAKGKERRANRKARREERRGARQERREDRRSTRARRREARTGAMERGEGFFQKAGGALADFGAAAKIGAEAQALAAEDGFDLDFGPMDVQTVAREAVDLEAGSDQSFFQKYQTPILVGGGLVAAGILFMALRPKKKGRRR